MRIIYLFIFLIYSTTLYSQSSIGISVNPNISDVYDTPFEQIKSSFGLDMGIKYESHISKDFSLISGLIWTRKTFQFDSPDFRPLDPSDPILNMIPGKLIYTIDYLEIPLLINYTIHNNSRIKLIISAGVSNSFYLSESVKDKSDPTIAFTYVSEARNYLFGVSGGLGLVYKLNDNINFRLTPNVKYQLNQTYEGERSDKFRSYGVKLETYFKL